MGLKLKMRNEWGISFLEIVALSFYFLVEINVELFVHRPLYIGAVALLIFAFGLSKNLKIANSAYLLWLLAWAGVTGASIIYSINRAYTLTALLTILARGLALYLIISRVSSIQQLVYVLKLFVNVVFLNLLYIFTRVDVTKLGVSRLGVNTINSDVDWNSNSIGVVLAVAVAIILVLLHYKQYRGKNKIVAGLQFVTYTIVVVLCGSRMAIMLMVALPLLNYLFSSNIRNTGKRLIIIILVLFGLYFLMMNIPQAYTVLGSRVERLIQSITGHDVTDISINSRHRLISLGIEWFKSSPIFGYGMYTYMALSSSYFTYAWYAHNNYIEVLVGTGIIGLLTYYWYYIYLIYKTRTKKMVFSEVIIPIMIVMLIGEYGSVSFKSFSFQFMLAIATTLYYLGYTKEKYAVMGETNEREI